MRRTFDGGDHRSSAAVVEPQMAFLCRNQFLARKRPSLTVRPSGSLSVSSIGKALHEEGRNRVRSVRVRNGELRVNARSFRRSVRPTVYGLVYSKARSEVRRISLNVVAYIHHRKSSCHSVHPHRISLALFSLALGSEG